MIDLKPSGNWFTWHNRQGQDAVWERLDRALCNSNWMSNFPHTHVSCLPIFTSDHSPVLITTHHALPFRNRPKRFEAFWLTDPTCHDVVFSTWATQFLGSSAYKVKVRLNLVLHNLLRWNKQVFGKLQQTIEVLEQNLQNFQHSTPTSPFMQQCELQTRQELEKMLFCEATLWAQKSQQMWLLHGDCNSKYFHAVVNGRRIKQNVLKLKDEQGNWITNYSDLEAMTLSHFQQVYTNQDLPTSQEISDKLQHISLPTLLDQHLSLLSAPITAADVEAALFQMKADKSPGPDGLPVLFFHTFWSVLKSDIIAAVQSFFTSGYLLKDFNHTLITLIPKCDHPQTVKDFRPISLCNVIQKLIFKVMVNRLQPILQDLISPTQNGFLKGRSINDNIFLASELMTYIHKAKRLKTKCCALTLDISKAYDRLSWSFIETVLKRMLFPEHWILLLQQCYSTVSYSLF